MNNHKCYEHIKGQRDAWKAALKEVDSRIGAFRSFLEVRPSELIFTSCGSPYHLGESNATLWRERFGLHATVAPSSEVMLFPESMLPHNGNPVLLVASRSGETTETIRAVETFAERFPGRTILLGCQNDSKLGRLADLSIIVSEADDREVVPQTRSFGAMYLAAQYLVALVAEDAGLAANLKELPELLPDLIEKWEPIMQQVAKAGWNSAVFLGSGPLCGVTAEASLKLTEMSLSSAVSYHTLEVRHGPRSIIDEKTLVVGLGSLRGAFQERQVLTELAEQTPHVVSLTSGDGWDLSEIATEISLGDQIPEHALGLLYLPLLQLLAYHRALHNRVNPDESRNLTSYIVLPEGS